jgi:uncharacterized membrane protein YebE (DUF533 family)
MSSSPRSFLAGKGVPLFNIALGAVMAGLGGTGKATLIGTNSTTALLVAGGALAAWGVFQLWRQSA